MMALVFPVVRMIMYDTPMPPFPWQSEIWQRFCESIEQDRVAHAMLLSGVVGVGIEQLGVAMARFLLCQSPIEDVACGRCRGCQLLAADTHPDLYRVRCEDSASQIKVDQIRACVDFVATTSHAGGAKVVVVEYADLMNTNAANALLKSLEEPQGNTVFILTTNQFSSILPTIRSRCRVVDVAIPPRASAIAWLAEHELPTTAELLDDAGGAPLLVKQWSESDYLSIRTKVEEAVSALMKQSQGAVQVAGQWQSIEVERVLEIQLQIIERAIKAAFTDVEQVTNELLSLLAHVPKTYLFRLRDKLLSKVQQARSNANPNPLMMAEELAMDWVALGRLVR